jgi:hypothetical protein
VEPAADLAQQGPPLLRQRGRQPGGRVERLGDLQEVRGIQPASPDGASHPGFDVVGGTDPDAGPLLQERSGLVGLVKAPGHDHRVGGGLESLGQPAGRGEGRVVRET